MVHVYIASGWWQPGHKQALEILELWLQEQKVGFFSPRLVHLCPPDASDRERKAAFDGNLRAIENANLVFARVDDYDPGTVWEMGYAFGRTPVVAWSLVPMRKLNLMLAHACQGYVNGWKQIQSFFRDGKINMEVAGKWQEEIE